MENPPAVEKPSAVDKPPAVEEPPAVEKPSVVSTQVENPPVNVSTPPLSPIRAVVSSPSSSGTKNELMRKHLIPADGVRFLMHARLCDVCTKKYPVPYHVAMETAPTP